MKHRWGVFNARYTYFAFCAILSMVAGILLATAGGTILSAQAADTHSFSPKIFLADASGKNPLKWPNAATFTCEKKFESQSNGQLDGITVNGGKFRYAVYTEHEVSDSPDGDFFLKAEKSGQQLRIDTVGCADNGKFTLTPAADQSAGANQENVVLTVDGDTLAKHLSLIYLDTSLSIDVPIYKASSEDGSMKIEGNTYTAINPEAAAGSQLGTAVFTKENRSDQLFRAQLTIDVPREHEISIRFLRNGQSTCNTRETKAEKTVNASTANRRVQTYDLAVGNGCRIFIAHTSATSQKFIYEKSSVDVIPSTSYATTSPSPRVNAYSYCDNWDIDANRCLSNSSVENTNRGFTRDFTDNENKTPAAEGGVDGTSPGAPFPPTRAANGSRSAFTFYTDIIPPVTTGSSALYNSMLSMVTVNGEGYAIPMPQPCLNPETGALPTKGDGEYECLVLTNQQKDQERYVQYREWMLGGSTLPGKLLTSQYVPTGVNAGMTLRVTLVDARVSSDSELLAKGGQSASSSVSLPNFGHRNLIQAGRWRFRYKVELLGVANQETTFSTTFSWNTHNRWLVTATRGVSASSETSNDSVGAYSRIVDETYPFDWRELCNPGVSCSYAWSELMESPNKFRFHVKDGWIQPQTWVNGELQFTTKDAGYLTFSAEKRPDAQVAGAYGQEQYWARTDTPISVQATPISIPVKYYDTEGKPLSGAEYPSVTVDVATNTTFAVTTSIPTKADKVFNGWALVGYKNRSKVHTLQTSIQGATLVDIASLVKKSSTRLLTNTYGEQLIDELRLIPNADTTVFGTVPGYFPVTRSFTDSSHEDSTLFSYRAVPGLSAEINEAYLNRSDVTTITEGAVDYQLTEDSSTLVVESLPQPAGSPRLTLMYEPQGAQVSFKKTVKNSSTISIEADTTVKDKDFALTLTSKNDSSKVFEVKSSSTETVRIPADTYILGERHYDSSGAISKETQRWLPDSTGYECHKDGEEDNAVVVSNDGPILDITGGTVECELTNDSAVLGILTYLGDINNTWVMHQNDQNYTYSLSSQDNNAYTEARWHADSLNRSQRFITPGASYAINTTVPENMIVLGIDKCTGGQSQCTGNPNVSTNWTPVSGEYPVVVNAGDRALYRVRVKPKNIVSSVEFTKTVDNQTIPPSKIQGVGTAGTPSDFSLEATWTGSVSGGPSRNLLGSPVTIDHGQTYVDIPAGTYSLAELSTRGQADGNPITDPYYGLTSAGYTCTSNTGDSVVSGSSLTVGVGQHITCSATNGLTLVSLLAWDSARQQYFSDDDVRITFHAESESAVGHNSVWTAKDTQQSSTGALTPNVAYTVTSPMVNMHVAIRLERYTGTEDPTSQAAKNSADWETVDSIIQPGATHGLYRMVYDLPYQPTLPLTGGRASDAFLIGGLLALLSGLLSAYAVRRRTS